MVEEKKQELKTMGVPWSPRQETCKNCGKTLRHKNHVYKGVCNDYEPVQPNIKRIRERVQAIAKDLSALLEAHFDRLNYAAVDCGETRLLVKEKLELLE